MASVDQVNPNPNPNLRMLLEVPAGLSTHGAPTRLIREGGYGESCLTVIQGLVSSCHHFLAFYCIL